MAGQALAGPFEHLAAGGRITGDGLTNGGRTGQAADVGDKLPDLVGAELGEGRHLGSANAAANAGEDLAIRSAVTQRSGGERRAAVAAGRLAVAGLAGLIVELVAGLHRPAVSGERVFLGLGGVLLGGEPGGKTEEQGKGQEGANLHERIGPI